MNKSADEYAEHIRAGAIARSQFRNKGDIIYWYETIKETRSAKKNGKQRILNGYSIVPDNLNVERYKRILMSKLKDTFEIVGIVLSNLNHDVQIELS